MPTDHGPYRYAAPVEDSGRRSCLVPVEAGASDLHFVFYDQLEIGRDVDDRGTPPGVLRIADPSVSRRHCILTRDADGRCFVRDVSTNGVWIDDRRLVPNLEVEIKPGQILGVGTGHRLRLEEEGCARTESKAPMSAIDDVDLSTVKNAVYSEVTVLVGDIRRYTHLVTAGDPVAVEQSVSGLFQLLQREVSARGGTLKEYPGDAIIAFWEERAGAEHALAACGAAVALERRVREIANDPELWKVPGFPLAMDWALATGPVIIQTLGDDRPMGLSMVGAPLILAFRLEKLADPETGSILVCDATRTALGDAYRFRDLGEVAAKGFDRPQRAFALEIE